jgi:hypothetical protein
LFKVQSQLIDTITIQWTYPFRKIQVLADDSVIGEDLDSVDFMRGYAFVLHNGTKISLKSRPTGWQSIHIDIRVNNHPVEHSRPRLNRFLGFCF